MKRNPLALLLFILFSISLAVNVLITTESQKAIENKMEKNYIMKHYYVQKMLTKKINENEFEEKKKQANEFFEVKIIQTSLHNSKELIIKKYDKKHKKYILKNFNENREVQFVEKENKKVTIHQYVPINKGEKGYLEIVYDGENYQKEYIEGKKQLLLQVGAIIAFHIIVILIVGLIANRTKKVFE